MNCLESDNVVEVAVLVGVRASLASSGPMILPRAKEK